MAVSTLKAAGTATASVVATGQADVRPLEAQLRELFGRVAYSHKTHEKAADRNKAVLGRINLAQIVLSALTTTSLLLAVFGDHRLGTIIGAGLAALQFGLSLYARDSDLGVASQKHAETAHRLWAVRETYLSLLTDLASSCVGEEEARGQRDELQKRLDAIYEGAPRTTPADYRAAQKALKVKEDLTFSDAEIDQLLPSPLRKGKGNG